MEIISQNLGIKKLLKNNKFKYQDQPQTEAQAPQSPAFEGMVGLKQLGKYGAAALLLAGSAALTSCEETNISHSETWNVYVEKNTDELEQKVDAFIAKFGEYTEQMLQAQNTIILLLQQSAERDAAFQAKVMQLLNEFYSMLNAIQNSTELNAQYAKEGLALYNQILTAVLTNNNLLSNYGNQVVGFLSSIKDAIIAGNESIIAVLELMWADINSGNTKIFNAITELGSIMETNNDELIETITNIYADDKLSEDERSAAIIAAINEVKVAVNSVKEIIKTADGELKEILTDILAQYNKNEITSQKMMELIYNALIEGNTLDKLQLEQIHAIYVKLENGELTNAEALKEIASLLGQINDTLKGMSTQLNDIYNAIVNQNNDVKNGHQKISEQLETIINNQNTQTSYLEALRASAKDQNEKIDVLNSSSEKAIEILLGIYEKTGKVTMEELKAILKENNDAVITTIETALKELGITIDNSTNDAVTEIVDAMKIFNEILAGNKEDIDTIINILSSIDLNTSLTNSQMDELLKLVKEYGELAKDENATQAEISAKLDGIRELLESIDTTVKAIYDELKAQADAFNAAYAEMKAYADKFYAALGDIKGNTDVMVSNGEQVLAKLDALKADADKVINYLEQIEANQDDDITLKDLKDLSAENLAAIEKMLDNLGLDAKAFLDAKLGDVIAAVKASAIDLTTTNNLLQTLIDLVGSIAGTMPDNAELNATLDELLEAYKAGNADLSAKLEAANVKLQAIYDQIVELFDQVADIASEVKTLNSLYQTGTTNVLNKIDEIINGLKDANTTMSSVNASMTVANTYLESANAKADEAIALLEQLGAKEDDGLTKAQLEEVLADAGVSLQTMLNNLGITINDNTNNAAAEIVNAIRNSGIDMTTTNNLLQTIIDSTGALLDSVNSLSNRDITIDTSNVETKLDSLITAMSSGNTASSAQMSALNQAIQDLIKEVKALAEAQKNQESGSNTGS